jgi:putative hydrolase of the HAD superfamily
MIQAVIFDYGNVLSQTLDPRPRAVWEDKIGLTSGGLQQAVHNDQSWVEVQCGRMSTAAYWNEVGKTLNLTPQEVAALRMDFYRGDSRNDDLVARIDQIRTTGLRTAILSNFSPELRTMLTQQALQQRFDAIVISAEIGVMKPAAAAYQAVLDRLALPAARCVFIDDQAANIAAAQALGMYGIVFRDNASCLAALDRLLICH